MKTLNMFRHQGYRAQNHIAIPSHPGQNGILIKNTTAMLAKILGKEHLRAASGNLNQSSLSEH